MPVRLPSFEQIDDLGSDFGLVLPLMRSRHFSRHSKDRWLHTAGSKNWSRLVLAPIAPRSPGYRPEAAENRYGAWYWKTDISTDAKGLLSGKKVAIKDNICVAGVPMMNGSALLEGYVPEFDATVVTRILEFRRHRRGKSGL